MQASLIGPRIIAVGLRQVLCLSVERLVADGLIGSPIKTGHVVHFGRCFRASGTWASAQVELAHQDVARHLASLSLQRGAKNSRISASAFRDLHKGRTHINQHRILLVLFLLRLFPLPLLVSLLCKVGGPPHDRPRPIRGRGVTGWRAKQCTLT